jgi:mannan endo-1,4-beta-mannosidase
MTSLRVTLATALAATAVVLAGPAWADLKVQGDRLVEASGRPLVIRGVNVHHAWAPDRTRQSLKDIAATGANTVRVVLSDGSRWKRTSRSQVAEILDEADRLKLVVILEVHDATGFGDPSPDAKGAVHLGALIPYWLSLKPLIEGREDRVLVNIANEPFSVRGQPSPWFEAHRTAIVALRAAGLRHVLVVDGDNYGQDSSGTMRDSAAALLAADPQRNTVFSVHMYQVYGQGETVRAYLDAFQIAGLPLIIGEFGPDHAGEPVDEATIMRLSAERQIGWLAWSWSGNSRKVADLDMVQGFDAARLSPWGQRVIDGPDGLRQTARPAEVFAAPLRRPPVWRRALTRLRGAF